MTRTPIAVATVAAAGALALASTVPAQATVYERLTAVEEFSGSYQDCGPTFSVTGVFRGHLLIREGTGPAAGTFPVLDRTTIDETHTNTVTGQTFTVHRRSIFNEVQARPLGDDVFEFTVIETGQPLVIEDAAGRVVLRDRGAVRYTFLFDTGGDDMPGGDYLTDFIPTEPTAPRPSWDADWCTLALSLTTA